MTETQIQFLTEYIGKCWHKPGEYIDVCYKCGEYFDYATQGQNFFTNTGKGNLLKSIQNKNELSSFINMLPCDDIEGDCSRRECPCGLIFRKLLFLPPLETAELVCKWKGVE